MSNNTVLFDYQWYQEQNNQLKGYVKVLVDVRTALRLAELTPYPSGVKLAIMKQVSNTREITLEQMRILLGWSARKSQAQGVYR